MQLHQCGHNSLDASAQVMMMRWRLARKGVNNKARRGREDEQLGRVRCRGLVHPNLALEAAAKK